MSRKTPRSPKSPSKVSTLRARKPSPEIFYSAVANGRYPECYTHWDCATHKEVNDYLELLDVAHDERPMQAFFHLHRHFLVEHLGGGHGRWVIPQKRLGSEHITDFMIGASHSLGVDWVAVEIESPCASLFTKAGNPSAILTHAVRQITDWRSWLTNNLGYARGSQDDGGLGLEKIRPDVDELILIGRRSSLSGKDNALRSQMSHDLRIAIHTYDYISDVARGKAEVFEKRREDL